MASAAITTSTTAENEDEVVTEEMKQQFAQGLKEATETLITTSITSFHHGVRDFTKSAMRDFPEHRAQLRQAFEQFLTVVKIDRTLPLRLFEAAVRQHVQRIEQRDITLFEVKTKAERLPLLDELGAYEIWKNATQTQRDNIWVYINQLTLDSISFKRAQEASQKPEETLASMGSGLSTQTIVRMVKQLKNEGKAGTAPTLDRILAVMRKSGMNVPEMSPELATQMKQIVRDNVASQVEALKRSCGGGVDEKALQEEIARALACL